ncbi:hypothetical protein [Reyranella sp.]
MDMHIAQDLPLTGVDVYSLPPTRARPSCAASSPRPTGWSTISAGPS